MNHVKKTDAPLTKKPQKKPALRACFVSVSCIATLCGDQRYRLLTYRWLLMDYQ
jgi:hypothetical protein